VQNCWLGDDTVSLPDLNTESEDVQKLWYDWIAGLVSDYSSKFGCGWLLSKLSVAILVSTNNFKSTASASTRSNTSQRISGLVSIRPPVFTALVKSLMETRRILVRTRRLWMVC
jgi:hypothetical protein